ncbi:MAG: hypothetical protein QOJ68_3391 [Blastococcus sp.]|nr:hypothetical protein [Blastococcus sp.]
MTGARAANGDVLEPQQVIDVDLPLTDVAPGDEGYGLRTVSGDPLRRGPASVLVRVHGSPVARVSLQLPDGVDRATLFTAVHAAAADEIAAHLRGDGASENGDQQGAGATSAPQRCSARPRLPDPAPRATVVVPTVGREDLGPCLDSLLGQDYPDFEIVVVDNSASTSQRDVLHGVLRGRTDPGGRLRHVVEPRPGVSFARNRGLAEATGDVVAFVDDDVLVDRGWLRSMVAAFDTAPGVQCVTGLVLPWQLETPEQVWFEQYGGFGKGFSRRVFDLNRHRGDHVLYPYLPGQYGTGANIAFRAPFLRELGGFDPVLGRRPVVGGEDIDVLLRTVLSGASLVYEPQALLWFQPYRSYAAMRRQMLIYGRGLSAVILKAALADRHVAWDIARRLPAGVRFLLDPGSTKNAGKRDYPRDLTRRELAGVLSGPVTYAWSRMRTRRDERAIKARGMSEAPPA